MSWRRSSSTTLRSAFREVVRCVSSSSWSRLADLDRVVLKEMSFFGYHGVYPHERLVGQRFDLDVTIFCSLLKAGNSDNLNDTISYATVFSQVKKIVEGEPANLVEHVAERIAKEVLEHHLLAEGIEVSIRKPNVSISGMMAASVGTVTQRIRSSQDKTQ